MNYPDLLKALIRSEAIVSPHGEKTKELMNVSLTVTPHENLFVFGEARSMEKILGYWFKEMAWYMSGDRDTKFIEQYAKLWGQIKNADGTANSNYGFLVFYNQTPHPSLRQVTLPPFEWAKRALLAEQDTRQAVITYNTGAFNFVGNKDYICSQHQAFFIRDNKLRCFIALRSSDAIWGLPYNMLWWSFVQQQLWHALVDKYPVLKIGDIEVQIYSAHLYERHFKLADKMMEILNWPPRSFGMELKEAVPLHKSLEWYLENLESKISFEEAE